jgi:hypothetical protein
MNETNRQHELSKIYGKLNSQDVEQFYAGYQLWQLQQRALTLQAQIEDLRREIAANAELMEMVHLPAIALAAMARLQASGVNDIALLDRMLERGEEWLDRTMQRLDYCEQLDFIIDDYTQWCQGALEGAYDWIDSIREGRTSSPEAPASETTSETTEELLLQKLTSEEDEVSTSEELVISIEEPQVTVATPPHFEETTLKSQEEQASQVSQLPQLPQSVEANPVPEPLETSSASDISSEQAIEEDTSSSHDTMINPAPTDSPPTELSSILDSQLSTVEAPESQQPTSQTDRRSDSPLEEPPHTQPGLTVDKLEHTDQESTRYTMPQRSPNFLQRLVTKIWG